MSEISEQLSSMSPEDKPGDRGPHALVTRLYKRHRFIYAVAMAALVMTNIFVGSGWWTFWPMCAWTIVFSFHFFYYKSVTVDESWVEERADDMRSRSYDLSHIYDIENRVEHRHSSVRPSDERDR